jgi:hypothetical protein
MRKAALSAAGLALFCLNSVAQAQSIAVAVNGERVRFPYAQPTQVAGRVMVPLRGVLERLGADRIDWRPARQEVFVSGVGGDIILRIGDRTAEVDGRRVLLDVPPLIMSRTTMVPLRFVSENLGARVDWLPETQTVYIATPTDRVAGSRERLPADDADQPIIRERPIPRNRTNRQRPAREERVRSAYLADLFPRHGAMVNDPRPEIFAQFRRNASIDYNSVQLRLNGKDVTRDAQVTAEGVRYLPLDDVRRGRNDVELSFRDTRGLRTSQQWHFFAP